LFTGEVYLVGGYLGVFQTDVYLLLDGVCGFKTVEKDIIVLELIIGLREFCLAFRRFDAEYGLQGHSTISGLLFAT
jgi:hypothetical protein